MLNERGHTSEERWTRPYGRKYVYIALYELAGYRDDLGLLRSDWDNGWRISFMNIDPSFPVDIKEFKLVYDNFLGNKDIPIVEWILEDYTPDLKPYLILDEIDGEYGPWVLLDGYIGQTNNDTNRDIYIFPRGFFVKSKDAREIKRKLNQQDLYGRWLPEVAEDHDIYGGEIPWSDTFPKNEWDVLSFVVDKEIKIVPSKKRTLKNEGRILSKSRRTRILG